MRSNHLALAAAATLLLAGCAAAEPPAGDQPQAVTETPAPVEQPTGEPTEDPGVALAQAVTDYTNAYFAGDWDVAYEQLWSARCKADNDARNSFMGTLMAQEVNYPEGSERPQPGIVTVDRIEGALGLVTYDFTYQGQTQTIPAQAWILEDGTWRYDAC